MAQLVKNPPAMWETWVLSLIWEKGEANHSSILAWQIPRAIQSMGSQRVRHDWVTFTFTLSLTSSVVGAQQKNYIRWHFKISHSISNFHGVGSLISLSDWRTNIIRAGYALFTPWKRATIINSLYYWNVIINKKFGFLLSLSVSYQIRLKSSYVWKLCSVLKA